MTSHLCSPLLGNVMLTQIPPLIVTIAQLMMFPLFMQRFKDCNADLNVCILVIAMSPEGVSANYNICAELISCGLAGYETFTFGFRM